MSVLLRSVLKCDHGPNTGKPGPCPGPVNTLSGAGSGPYRSPGSGPTELPRPGTPPHDLKDLSVLGKLIHSIAQSRGTNLVPLADLRSELPQDWSRQRQDTAIAAMIEYGAITGSNLEGRQGITQAERDAAVQRPGEAGVMGFVSIRRSVVQASPAGGQVRKQGEAGKPCTPGHTAERDRCVPVTGPTNSLPSGQKPDGKWQADPKEPSSVITKVPDQAIQAFTDAVKQVVGSKLRVELHSRKRGRDKDYSVVMQTPGGGDFWVMMTAEKEGDSYHLYFRQGDTSIPESERGKGLSDLFVRAAVAGFGAVGVKDIPIHGNINPSFWSHMNAKYGIYRSAGRQVRKGEVGKPCTPGHTAERDRCVPSEGPVNALPQKPSAEGKVQPGDEVVFTLSSGGDSTRMRFDGIDPADDWGIATVLEGPRAGEKTNLAPKVVAKLRRAGEGPATNPAQAPSASPPENKLPTPQTTTSPIKDMRFVRGLFGLDPLGRKFNIQGGLVFNEADSYKVAKDIQEALKAAGYEVFEAGSLHLDEDFPEIKNDVEFNFKDKHSKRELNLYARSDGKRTAVTFDETAMDTGGQLHDTPLVVPQWVSRLLAKQPSTKGYSTAGQVQKGDTSSRLSALRNLESAAGSLSWSEIRSRAEQALAGLNAADTVALARAFGIYTASSKSGAIDGIIGRLERLKESMQRGQEIDRLTGKGLVSRLPRKRG